MNTKNDSRSGNHARDKDEKRQAKFIEDVEKRKLGLDSYFMFHCTMCGDCCRNRDDILLTPKNLFNLAKGLNMTPQEIIEKYCDVYIGHTTNMTVVRLKSIGWDRHCVFLEDNKCSVQNFKPSVCALFPIGRYIMHDSDTGESEGKVGYIFTNPNCGDKQQIHTVRSWLRGFDIPAEDDYFEKWSDLVAKQALMLTDFVKTEKSELMSEIWNFLLFLCYLRYDVKKEFMPQFEKNAEDVLDTLQKIDELRKARQGAKNPENEGGKK